MTGPVVHGQQVEPGDVLVCEGGGAMAKLIEIGAILVGDLAASHVAVYHHSDANGTPWAIEGRPGGVGWRDARDYCTDPRTVVNATQPKTPQQREIICSWTQKLLGTAYDWSGIAADTLHALNLPDLWKPDPGNGTVPGQFVCSSFAAWVYHRTGLDTPHPEDWRTTTPGAWALYIAAEGWKNY